MRGFLLLLALAGAPLACGFPGSGGEVVTLEVGPETVACVGEAEQRCLRVREPPESEWRNFYDTIEGFTHEEGWVYRLSVLRERVEHPLADASSFTWKLLEVLARERPGDG
jgi:hypothetical protein